MNLRVIIHKDFWLSIDKPQEHAFIANNFRAVLLEIVMISALSPPLYCTQHYIDCGLTRN